MYKQAALLALVTLTACANNADGADATEPMQATESALLVGGELFAVKGAVDPTSFLFNYGEDGTVAGYSAKSSATFTGAKASGSLTTVGGGAIQPLAGNAASEVNILTVNANVKGCGSGTFKILFKADFQSANAQGKSAFAGTWSIISGSGAGSLAGIKGAGILSGTLDGATLTYEDKYYGVIQCN